MQPGQRLPCPSPFSSTLTQHKSMLCSPSPLLQLGEPTQGPFSPCAKGHVAYKPKQGDALMFYDLMVRAFPGVGVCGGGYLTVDMQVSTLCVCMCGCI